MKKTAVQYAAYALDQPPIYNLLLSTMNTKDKKTILSCKQVEGFSGGVCVCDLPKTSLGFEFCQSHLFVIM